MDLSLPALRVTRSLERIIEWRGKPEAIRCDNGPEYLSNTLKAWAELRKIRIEYTQPGNPQQNAYIERYNRTVRYEWLAQYLFESVAQAQNFADHGYGYTIKGGLIWPLAESPPCKNWLGTQLNLYFYLVSFVGITSITLSRRWGFRSEAWRNL